MDTIMLFKRFNVLICFFVLFFFSACSVKGPTKDQIVPLDIACIGDSITYGYKLSDPAKNSYPAQLARKSYGQWRVHNLGVTGATVNDKGDIPYSSQNQYQMLMTAVPDVAVIMLGTNDLKNKNWPFVTDFIQDYSSMIEKIQNLPSHPQVVLCSVPPVFADHPNGISSERQKMINVLLSKVVDITGVEYLDLSDLLLNKKGYYIDGIHPNNAGAAAIANIVFKTVSRLQKFR